MFSIDNFKSSLNKRGGLAPANYYAVVFSPPNGSLLDLSNINPFNPNIESIFNDPRDITFLSQNATLPGRQFLTLDNLSVKHAYKVPYGFVDEGFSIEFIVTRDHYVTKMFNAWSEGIVDSHSYRAGYKKDYSVTMLIYSFDAKFVPLYSVKCINTFPVAISPVQMSAASKNDFLRLNVSFDFEDFHRGDDFSTVGGIIDAIGNVFSSDGILQTAQDVLPKMKNFINIPKIF